MILFSSFSFVPEYFDGKSIILIHSFPISFMLFFFFFFLINQLVSCLFVHQTSRAQRDFFSWPVFRDRPVRYRFWPNSSFYYSSILNCKLSIKISHKIITKKSFSILHSLTPLASKKKGHVEETQKPNLKAG